MFSKMIRCSAVAALALVCAACGSSSGSAGGSDGPGQTITVACVGGTATQAFPGQTWEEIEATVWFVGALPPAPAPSGYSMPTLGMMLTPLTSKEDTEVADAVVTDGNLVIPCGTVAYVSGAGENASAVPAASIELYQRQ